MESNVDSVSKQFLEDNRKINKIPVYQRNYSWDKEQCETLFNDLMVIYDSDNTTTHFIGSIVYKFEGTISSARVIIDGQQRLTTLYLLCKAIYDLIEDDDRFKWKLEDVLQNGSGENTLVPIKSDNEVYANLLSNRFGLIKEGTSRIYENYLYFKNRLISEKIDLPKIYESISYFEIVQIGLSNDEHPQIIFESINSTGVSLSNSDLIRNYLLMNEGYDRQEELFNNYWYVFEQKLGVTNLEMFFEHYINILSKRPSVSRKKMYGNFKDIYTSKDMDLKDFFEELKQYVDAYYYLLHPEEFSEHYTIKGSRDVAIHLQNIQSLDSKVVNMFLMNVLIDFDKDIINIDQLNEILYTVETYILRRMVCSLSSNTLQKIFRYLHRQILSTSSKLDYMDSFYYNFVISKKNTNGRMPTDDEFYESLINMEVYKNSKLCKFILGNIETYNTKNILIVDELSIEHVMPQTLTNQWKDILGEDYRTIHSTYLNRLGNLTLTSVNSELSNKSLNDKLNILRDEGHIRMNEYFKNVSTWNEYEIERRTKLLANKVVEYFPYPTFDEDKIDDLIKEDMLEIEFDDIAELNSVKLIKSIVIDDIETNIKTYRDIYITIVEYVYNKDKVKFYEEFVDNENYSRIQRGEKIYTYALNNPHSFDFKIVTEDEIKIDTDRDTSNILKAMKKLIDSYEVDIKVIVIKKILDNNITK